MALYDSAYLRRLTTSYPYTMNYRVNDESRKNHTSFDIFLSHSLLDREEVFGLFLELTQKGYSVYVDWIVDPQLNRENVDKKTAELIRNRMKSSKSLLLAISANATMSKWIPWELGFADGKTTRCAIVPVSRDSSQVKTFKRSEYLLLYPYLKRAAVSYPEELFITESSNEFIDLERWVRSGRSPEFRSTNIDAL